MSCVNKVILIGYLGNDPDLRRTANDNQVAVFNLGVTEKNVTQWLRIVCWGHRAEFVNKMLKKGSQVFVEGKLQNNNWETKDGEKRFTTEVYADRIEIMGKLDKETSEIVEKESEEASKKDWKKSKFKASPEDEQVPW